MSTLIGYGIPLNIKYIFKLKVIPDVYLLSKINEQSHGFVLFYGQVNKYKFSLHDEIVGPYETKLYIPPKHSDFMLKSLLKVTGIDINRKYTTCCNTCPFGVWSSHHNQPIKEYLGVYICSN